MASTMAAPRKSSSSSRSSCMTYFQAGMAIPISVSMMVMPAMAPTRLKPASAAPPRARHDLSRLPLYLRMTFFT